MSDLLRQDRVSGRVGGAAPQGRSKTANVSNGPKQHPSETEAHVRAEMLLPRRLPGKVRSDTDSGSDAGARKEG